MLKRTLFTLVAGACLPGAAHADPLALRLPSSGGVVAIGWGAVSGGYWADPHLGFSVDAALPGTVGISAGTRASLGRVVGVDFGAAAGPVLDVRVPSLGLQVTPWLDFAYRGPVLLSAGVVLPGRVGLSTFGASWAAPLLLEASLGVPLGPVRIGAWGNVGATVAAREWTVQGNAGIWLGVGEENKRRGQ